MDERVIPTGVVLYLHGGSLRIDDSLGVELLVLENGEITVDAHTPSTQPFQLNLCDVGLQAAQAHFAVRVLGATRFELRVTRGSLEVHQATDVAPTVLSAPLHMQYDSATHTLEPPPPPAESESMLGDEPWNTFLMFRELTLERLLALLSRHTPEQYALADPALGAQLVSGHFFMCDGQGVKILLRNRYGLTVRRREQRYWVRSASPA